jgi:hypothetical protein
MFILFFNLVQRGRAATRWLSLEAVVNRILEQWPALTLYFNEKWLDQKLIATEQIYKCLNDPFMKLYFLFLKWVLPKFNRMKQYFQSEKVLLTDMHRTLSDMFQDILTCFMDRAYVFSKDFDEINPEDRTKFKPKNVLYLGVEVIEQLKDPKFKEHPELLDYFYDRCRSFLSQVCVHIKKRINFNDPVLQNCSVLNPRRAWSHDERDLTPSLYKLLTLVPRIASHENYQKIDDEWRQLQYYPLQEKMLNEETDIFWHYIRNIQNEGNEFLFKNVGDFVFSSSQ